MVQKSKKESKSKIKIILGSLQKRISALIYIVNKFYTIYL